MKFLESKKRYDLITPTVVTKKYDEIENIFKLKFFEDNPELLTPSTFKRTYNKIKEIVELEELKKHKELFTPSIYNQEALELRKIINLKCFKRHPNLLTPGILKKNALAIEKTIDYIEYELKMPGLLKVSVITRKLSSIKECVSICKDYGYHNELNNNPSIFKNTPRVLKAKFNYLAQNGIYTYNEENQKFHPILLLNESEMKKNYGIDNKYLLNNYSKRKEKAC